MPKLIRQLISLLTRRQRVQAALLLAALIVRAGVELLGVASVAPFLELAANPGAIHSRGYLQWLYGRGGFTTDSGFLVAAGVVVLALLVLSNGLSALFTWTMQRFVWDANHELAMRLLRGYLAQPYGFFVERNSASLNKNILSEVRAALAGVVRPVITFVAQILVVVAITGMLVAVSPGLAAAAVTVIGSLYGLVYLAVRRRQSSLGREWVEANRLRYKVTSEAFGGIKDVKVLQREEAFVAQFAEPSRRFTKALAANATIGQLPRYFLETLAFGGVVLVVVVALNTGRGLTAVLPLAGLYVFAGYRLMPAVQSLFAALVSIRFNRASLDELCEDLARFAEDAPAAEGDRLPLPFADAIELSGVSFRYPGAAFEALHGVSLTIERNQTVGIVGSTGSGKTTLVDLLLGLYEPDEGRLTVDGAVLDGTTIPRWRRQVGYVPQHIFLADDTVARNIAFGVPDDEIDECRVERAARIAHLHEFVATLPDGYGTVVGERGVRLSGGQRQRVGIARALYHDPEVLVMDEATSALDGVTETAVMDAIRELAGQKTIILIAHRLTTVQPADRIVMIEDGRVVDEGTYTELVARNETFRAMAKVPAGGFP